MLASSVLCNKLKYKPIVSELSNETKPLEYFDTSEFDCKETGENGMSPEFLNRIDKLREECGFAFVISSGYRSPTKHPVETAKKRPGTHGQGIAADIAAVNASQRFTIIENAVKLGFTGIGVANNFIHIDTRKTTPKAWTY